MVWFFRALFFFNDTATTEIYTLSLHDALPITVGPERTLGDVARLMVEHDIRALPVVDDAGSLIGMITHRELLRFLIPHFVQRTKTGEFHAPTRSQLQRGSADPQLIPAKEA